jgi:carbamoylphosphate synthase large subunit
MTNYKTILIGNNPYSQDWSLSLNLIKHNKNIILYDFENSKDIDELILKNRIEFILPLSNKDYNLISKFDINKNIKILYPNSQTQELLHNKNLFTKFMLNNFVDFIPNIYYLDEIKIKDIQYPAIYKPMYSTNGINMSILFNYNDFLNLKNKNNIQQYITDKYEYGAYMLCIDGIIINYKIIRQPFNDFNIKKNNFSKNYENVDFFDISIFQQIISKLNYSGGINFDFKFNVITNKLYIFEINPRFGGSAFSTNFIYELLCIIE